MSKRLAVLHVPKNDNHGNPIPAVLAAALTAAVAAFGGATVHDASGVNGYYVMNDGKLCHEPVHVVAIAYDATSENEERLTAIAELVAAQGNQECVMLTRQDARVDFVTAAHLEHNAAKAA